MKKLVLLAAFSCALALAIGTAQAEETTLTGEPVDIGCYLGGQSGEGHAACATNCVKAGKPVGLVVGEGEEKEMYLVLSDGIQAPKDVIADHMGKIVTVTGEIVEKDGMKMVKVSKVE